VIWQKIPLLKACGAASYRCTPSILGFSSPPGFENIPARLIKNRLWLQDREVASYVAPSKELTEGFFPLRSQATSILLSITKASKGCLLVTAITRGGRPLPPQFLEDDFGVKILFPMPLKKSTDTGDARCCIEPMRSSFSGRAAAIRGINHIEKTARKLFGTLATRLDYAHA
jgi:hypothetical protein